eukprot:1161872-Pelagomonas_calceolata.AAC.2
MPINHHAHHHAHLVHTYTIPLPAFSSLHPLHCSHMPCPSTTMLTTMPTSFIPTPPPCLHPLHCSHMPCQALTYSKAELNLGSQDEGRDAGMSTLHAMPQPVLLGSACSLTPSKCLLPYA